MILVQNWLADLAVETILAVEIVLAVGMVLTVEIVLAVGTVPVVEMVPAVEKVYLLVGSVAEHVLAVEEVDLAVERQLVYKKPIFGYEGN